MPRSHPAPGSAPPPSMRSGLADPALRDRIAGVDFVEGTDTVNSILPRANAVLGFQVAGRVRAEHGLLSTAGVTGIQDSARRVAYVGPTTSILVRFTPQGAACLGLPAQLLSGRSVALDELLPTALVRATQQRLSESRSDREWITIIQDLLRPLLFAADPVVSHALARLDAGPNAPSSIAAIARELAMSERQLERRFLRRVGISPRRFASLRRFERAVTLAKSAPSLTEAALEAGYYDQSHFVRDVRRFTGSTPGKLRR